MVSFLKRFFGGDDSPRNPALECALENIAKNDNPDTRESLYKAILSSTLIVQGRVLDGIEVSPGKWTTEREAPFTFWTTEYPPENVFLQG